MSHPNRNCVKDGALIFGSLKEKAATGAYALFGDTTLLIRFSMAERWMTSGSPSKVIPPAVQIALLNQYEELQWYREHFFKDMQVNEGDETAG